MEFRVGDVGNDGDKTVRCAGGAEKGLEWSGFREEGSEVGTGGGVG